MEALVDTLDEVERVLGGAAAGVFGQGLLRLSGDEELLAVAARVSAVSRLADALLVAVVGEVQERADAAPHAERITTRRGCRSVKELVQRVTRHSSRAVGEVMRGAAAVSRPVAITTGEVLPAVYPGMREALACGAVGIDGMVAVVGGLEGAGCAPEARLAADAELAAAAQGVGCDGAPAPCADELRVQAQVWAMFLDQDGTEPREARALRKRGLTLGVCRDGLVPVRGQLLPEVAGQLNTLFHAILNPKGEGPAAPTGPHFADTAVDDLDAPIGEQADPRTRTQRQHDAFATILSVAARSGEVPTIGGAAPTLVVSVTEQDLRSGAGFAHLDDCDEPVSLAVARHVACSGAIQRVTSDSAGRIRAIHTVDRVFGPHQRKAITLRDGGCLIPGCHVPAAWCEIHHVQEHSRGGPTHTDNGVLLCWHHHRTLDTGGWSIRMRNGIPEIRGPSWWDAPCAGDPSPHHPCAYDNASPHDSQPATAEHARAGPAVRVPTDGGCDTEHAFTRVAAARRATEREQRSSSDVRQRSGRSARARHGRCQRHRARVRAGVREARRARDHRGSECGCRDRRR